jgi:hypothetical protein
MLLLLLAGLLLLLLELQTAACLADDLADAVANGRAAVASARAATAASLATVTTSSVDTTSGGQALAWESGLLLSSPPCFSWTLAPLCMQM